MRGSAVFFAGVSLMSLAAPALAQPGQIINEGVPSGAVLPTNEPAGAERADGTGQLAPSDEIIVSARRRDEALKDVPQTVNVVTSAQVEKLNLRNFTDIASVVPGLQLQSTSAFGNNATVRGIAFSPEASGSNPSVEFYLNDAPISSAFLFQSTYDFGQFELQRGPQGTLRGRAAPSGSIAVTTRRPDLDEVGAVFNGTATDLHARKFDGAFNIPIIADVLAVRIAGVIDNSRGSRVRSLSDGTNADFTDGPNTRTKSIRASVRAAPTDWAQFDFMYQNLQSSRRFFEQVVSESLINPAAALATTAIVPAFSRRALTEQGNFSGQQQEVFIGNADFTFGGQRLSYVGSYNEQDNDIVGPQDFGNFFATPRVTLARRQAQDLPGFDQVCTNAVREASFTLSNAEYNQCTHSVAKRKSHELRLASEERIADIFDYVVGGFYDYNKSTNNLTQETPLLAALPGVAGPINVALVNLSSILTQGISTEKSVFGNLTAHLLDNKLELSGGLRYIDYKMRQSIFLSAGQGTPANLLVPCRELTTTCTRPVPDSQFHDKEFVYTGSIKYNFTEDFMVYALTGSSYRPGPRVIGDFSAAPSARERSFFAELPAEKSKSYEIGAKTSFLGGRGTFNISAFHQKFEDYPFRGPPVFFVSTNASTRAPEVSSFNFVSPVPVTVKGVEAEASYQIMDRWSLGLNAAYADGKVKNGTIACTDLDRNNIPDVNAATPTLAQLQAAVGAGETISQCSGINRRSSQQSRFSGNVQSEFGFDVGQNMDGFVRGLYSFFGKTSNDPDNSFDDVNSYGLLNLFGGIRDKDGAWEVTVFAKNVTKEREILTVGNAPLTTTVRSFRGNQNSVSQYRAITVTAPREFGVTARVAFGSR